MSLKGSYTREGGKKKQETAVKTKSLKEKSPHLLGAWKNFTKEVTGKPHFESKVE